MSQSNSSGCPPFDRLALPLCSKCPKHVKEWTKHLGYVAVLGQERRRGRQQWWEVEVFTNPGKGEQQQTLPYP